MGLEKPKRQTMDHVLSSECVSALKATLQEDYNFTSMQVVLCQQVAIKRLSVHQP